MIICSRLINKCFVILLRTVTNNLFGSLKWIACLLYFHVNNMNRLKQKKVLSVTVNVNMYAEAVEIR